MSAGYPLHALLSVRWFREDAAQNEARAAERRVAEARENVVKKWAELAEYQSWMPQEVDRRYETIMGQCMTLDDIDAFKAGLGALADGELNRQMAVAEAEQEVSRREAEVLTAKDAVAHTRREAAKIEAHREIWQEAEKKEAERQEDLEMEEFKPPAQKNDEE